MPLTQSDLIHMQRQVETHLVNIHGFSYIIGVGFGLEEIDGVLSTPPKIAFRVYFNSNEASQNTGGPIVAPPFLTPNDPPICTIDVAQWTGEAEPNTSFVPGPYQAALVSGLDIHSGSDHMDRGLGSGTLGFFATLNSESDKPKNVVLISNYHVLIKTPTVPGREFKEGDYVWRNKISIARIVSQTRPNGDRVAGLKASHLYSYQDYPNDVPKPYHLDCAAARLIREQTTCCKAICPDTWTEFKNVVQHLGTELPDDNVTNVSRLTHLALLESVQNAQAPDYKTLTVYKSGRTTGLTWGRVIDVLAPYPKKGLIIIESTKKDGNNNLMNFADHGDSGSALLNAQRELVGLVYALEGSNQTRAYACHIHPVLDFLGVTAVTTANPIAGSEAAAEMPFVIDDPGTAHAARLRGAFLDSTGGRRIADILLRYRSEILHLINKNRRVTVAWHRHKGPGFVNHLVKNVRDPDHPIPQEIDGVTREALIRTMARVLSEHGSAALAEAATDHLDQALEYVRRADSLHDLADALRKEEMA